MRTITYSCDRCLQPIAVGRTMVIVEAGSTPATWPSHPETGRPALDLCTRCMTDLTKWIDSPIVENHEGTNS